MEDQGERWEEVRDEAIRHYGEAASDEVEAELRRRYSVEPGLVRNAIARVARDETVRNPWSVVEHRTRSALGILAASQGKRRKLQEERAERWLREVGYQYPWRGCQDELFGRNGRLEQYAEDAVLRARIQTLWSMLQPVES